jgi:hypothetical protein
MPKGELAEMDSFTHRMRRGLVAVLALGIFMVAPTAAQAVLTDQTLTLDTNSPGDEGSGGAVTTNDLLQVGKLYVVEARGTYSKWEPAAWAPSGCGAPESAPMFPSAGGTTGPAGLDADTVFATINSGTCPPLPRHEGGLLQRYSESPFRHLEPFGGPKSAPEPGHLYTYGLVGNGIAASFRIADRPVADNYGALRIHVRLATADDCAEGWPSFGFGNEGECRSFFAQGGNVVEQNGGGGTTVVNPVDVGGNFVISHNSVRISKKGFVTVRVSCRSPLPCRGTMGLRTARRYPKGSSKAKKRKFGRTIKFDVPPKSRKRGLRFHLTKANRRLVRRLGVVKVNARAHVSIGDPPFRFIGKARIPVRRHR